MIDSLCALGEARYFIMHPLSESNECPLLHRIRATSARFWSVMCVATLLAPFSTRGLLCGAALTLRAGVAGCAGTCLRLPVGENTLRQRSEPTRTMLTR